VQGGGRPCPAEGGGKGERFSSLREEVGKKLLGRPGGIEMVVRYPQSRGERREKDEKGKIGWYPKKGYEAGMMRPVGEGEVTERRRGDDQHLLTISRKKVRMMLI